MTPTRRNRGCSPLPAMTCVSRCTRCRCSSDSCRTVRPTDERIALTQRIERAVGSLSELLDQLLDLSKLEAGAVQAVQQDFAVRDLLSAIEAEFASLARAKGIELRVLPTDAWLRSDPVLVRRILSEPGRKRDPLHRTRRRADRLPQARADSAHCGLGYRLRHSRRSTRRRVP